MPIKLGTEVVIIKIERKGKGKNFVHLHQSETTALKAARAVVAAKGGTILTLVHKGGRNIVFHLNKQRFEFDPNRIFSDIGIKKTLSQFGAYSPAAHKEVSKLAEKIKKVLPKGKIIAVHNNNEYSLKNYLPGHDMEHEAQELNYLKNNYHRNFYLVTKENDFYRFKELAFNSVLQAKQATDDGSLSIYLANRDYVNVEAGYDQLAAQIKMLNYA
nr:hypothetical protein [Legionella adelaidensis]